MKWWSWLILELLVMFGVMAYIYLFPSALLEEDFCKVLLAYVLIFCIEKTRKYFKGGIEMFNLNELCVMAYENAAKREAKDGKVSTDTRKMLKHCATKVVEAAEAYNSWVDRVANKEIFASELADIVCCVLIIAGKENIDMELALTECMEKNYKRAIGEGDK